ncbi:hypothetical protein J4410_02265 [Candidatus Woesearchaeota archaeon]|nr:hypothetical protein [Candidatus Woesearchaeota archaeon]
MRIRLVESYEKDNEEVWDYIMDVGAGRREIDPERAKRTLVLTPKTFAQVFSPERMRIILKLKEKKYLNIYQLAKELGRKYEAVHRNVSYLSHRGIIKIKTKDKKKIPYIHEPISIPQLTS